MRRAIDETERRRTRQIAFNEANGITPRGVTKKIKDLIDGVYDTRGSVQERKVAQEAARYDVMNEKQLAQEIKRLEKQMHEQARNLEFEKAAQTRDQLSTLKTQLFGADESGEAEKIISAEKGHVA